MTMPWALVLSALLLAMAIALATPRYTIFQSTRSADVFELWRLDRWSGALLACTEQQGRPVCLPARDK